MSGIQMIDGDVYYLSSLMFIFMCVVVVVIDRTVLPEDVRWVGLLERHPGRHQGLRPVP